MVQPPEGSQLTSADLAAIRKRWSCMQVQVSLCWVHCWAC